MATRKPAPKPAPKRPTPQKRNWVPAVEYDFTPSREIGKSKPRKK